MIGEEDYKILFDSWKRRINKLIIEHPLQIISWEATRRCNMSCKHCGSPSEDVNLQEELSTDEVINAFKEIADSFDMSTFRHINITGGEPFVRNDLLYILSRISQNIHFRNIDIQTNGQFLHDNVHVLDELNKIGVTGLGISIDGLEKTHDDFRNRAGSFQKAFYAAQKSVEKGYVVTVSVVAHSKNINEIKGLYGIVKREIKPRVFRIMTIDPIGRTGFDSEYLLNKNQIKEVLFFLKYEYTRNCHRYSDPKETMVELGCGGWLGFELEGLIRPFIFHCIAGINNLGILYDGKIASCSNISRDFIQGDLRKDSIRQIWDNKFYKFRNFEWKRIGICKCCDQWDYCHGGPLHKRSIKGIMSECLFDKLEKGLEVHEG